MNNLNFCTYFDVNYLSKGITLINSVANHHPNSDLYVLCLDDQVKNILEKIDLNLYLITLSDLEKSFPELRLAKLNRSIIEYYFTLTPFLLKYILELIPASYKLIYLDSDTFLFDNLMGINNSTDTITLTRHNFSKKLEKKLAKFGEFNVGLVAIAKNDVGFDFLSWWCSSCITWCKDIVEGNKFAEQGYLTQVPSLFPDVCVLSDLGVNVGPWNIQDYNLSSNGHFYFVNGFSIKLFHFHGLRKFQGRYYPFLTRYKTDLKHNYVLNLYLLYIKKLEEVDNVLLDYGIFPSSVRGKMMFGLLNLSKILFYGKIVKSIILKDSIKII
jgi:hypothetical protein